MTNDQIKAFLEKLVGSADEETSWEMSYKVLKGGVGGLIASLQKSPSQEDCKLTQLSNEDAASVIERLKKQGLIRNDFSLDLERLK